MSQNEQRRPEDAAAASTITCSQHISWPRCEACGQRAPTGELLERHRVRRCVGPIAPWRPWDAPRCSWSEAA